MEKNLNSYIKIYNILDKEKCQETVEELNHLEFVLHEFYNYKENKMVQYDKELSVYNGYSINHDYYMNQIWEALVKYMSEIKTPWFTGWTGFSSIRYNKYEPGTEMHIHCDHIHSLFDGIAKGVPTLSIVGCLNEDFVGGKFMMFENEEIKLKTGDILIFPSNFLYPHCVTEVTEGTRYTFVSWTW